MKTLLSRVLPNDISEYIYKLLREEYYNKVIVGKIYTLELVLRNYNSRFYIFNNIDLNNLYIEINTIDKFINSIYIFDKILIYEDDVLLDLIKYYIKIIEKHKKNSCKLLFTIKYDYDFWCNDYKTIFNKELYPEW
tara:strand:+ start:101 stop:508 length:408 start_codon:yes stop_codon:yes gene_type:complete